MLKHTKRFYVLFIVIALIGSLTMGACGFHLSSQAVPPKNYTGTAISLLNQMPRPIGIIRHESVVSIQLYAEETEVSIAQGVRFLAWTFDCTVPGPIIELRQGEDVSLTLHRLDPRMTHSIDLHAAFVPPSHDFAPVLPRQSNTLHFAAGVPGVFMHVSLRI